MALPRKDSIEFIFSSSFDDDKHKLALEERDKALDKKVREDFYDCYHVISAFEKRQPLDEQNVRVITTNCKNALKYFNAISNHAKEDEITLLQLYTSFNRAFLLESSGKLPEWITANCGGIINIRLIISLLAKYPNDERVVSEITKCWPLANRVILLLSHAYIHLGMLDPALELLHLMNELLISLPDSCFVLQSDKKALCCWAYEHDTARYSLDQLLLDGLGLASDYESLYPGRGSRLMLLYAMIRIFSPKQAQDLFSVNRELTNAASTLRRPENALAGELESTFQLFKKSLQKAFTLVKSATAEAVAGMNKDVCYSLSQLNSLDELLNPNFRFREELKVKFTLSQNSKNHLTKFAMHEPVKTDKSQGEKRVAKLPAVVAASYKLARKK